ncbi:MAG: CHAT domain-containing protein [Wenzhouxiangellaceae bacterium]
MRTRHGWSILLVAVVVCCAHAQASTCLKETAPQVASYLVTGDGDRVRQAIAAIQERAEQPDAGLAAPWLAAQASMLLDIGAIDDAETRLRRAISGWIQAGNVAAEICTRRLLSYALRERGEPRAALSEVLLAEARARDAGLEDALNHLKQRHVLLLSDLRERLEEALILQEQTRPGESAGERILWHQNRGLMLGHLNRHRQAAAEFEQVLILAKAESLQPEAATARLNIAMQLTRLGRDDPEDIPEDRVVSLLNHVASDTRARPATRAMALRSLAQFRPLEQKPALLTECVRAAEQAGDDRRKAVCLADLAELEVAANPDRALERIDQAIALAESDPRALWQIQTKRLAVIWATEPPPQAFESSLQAIVGEKRLRELQMTGPERAQLIDGLSWDYRRLANRAYEHFDTHPELAVRAMELLEANRALVLREQRQLQRDETDDEAIAALAERINLAQKTLLYPEDPQHAERARRELERLEAAWREASVRPPQQAKALPQEPRLNDIRSALKPDEALLSFLTLVPGQDGGWLHVLTRDASRIYPVPAHYDLVRAAELLLGIPDWQDASARQLLERLAEQILASALEELEPGIRHLLVIPDRGIERLPLEMLPGLDGQPLGIRYSLDSAPSAGVWLEARRSQPGTAQGHVLALADPSLPTAGYRALNAAYPGERPASLPGAIGEVRQIRRLARSNKVHVRSGRAAAEGALNGIEPLAGIGLIHFATHTLIHPEAGRSAILLAADERGDGLLQPREIERLALSDVAVVLASCASAIGERLDNEGVISLARSFMIAGAPSVIATRWPVDDAHAQAFFQRFYWHLVGGHDQSDAMRRARADLRGNGYPERAWAAFVLYGDGRWQPLAPRRSGPAWGLLLLAAGLAAAVVVRKIRTG